MFLQIGCFVVSLSVPKIRLVADKVDENVYNQCFAYNADNLLFNQFWFHIYIYVSCLRQEKR